ncbi:hypothetical protein [Fictibacillus sp. NRS-1165]|uniref:ATP-dependent DNA ligase n=1 Tax=Fictibacillus sp. NRS-1165 TaxID=3144463 RepID=UPI003D21E218
MICSSRRYPIRTFLLLFPSVPSIFLLSITKLVMYALSELFYMFVSPMLLHKIEKPFNDDNYIAKLKLDGIRAIFSIIGNKPKLYTRHSNDISARFAELLSYPLPDGTILDGELVVTDETGKPVFESCMQGFFRSKGNITHTACLIFSITRARMLPRAL